MRQLWILGALALLVTAVPTEVRANPGAALGSGEALLVTMEKLSVGRIANAQAAADLVAMGYGREVAAGMVTSQLWATINELKARYGGVMTSAHWAALREQVKREGLTAAVLLSRRVDSGPYELVLVADAVRTNRPYVRAAAFGQQQVTPTRSYEAAPDATAAVRAVHAYVVDVPDEAQRTRVQQAVDSLVEEGMTIGGAAELEKVGRHLINTERTAPQVCATADVPDCIRFGKANAFLTQEVQADETFEDQVDDGFKTETPNYANGRGKLVRLGLFRTFVDEAYKESDELRQCVKPKRQPYRLRKAG